MITSVSQRWRDGRASYQPDGPIFDPTRHEVAAVDESTARAFVCRHHYAASYPAARFRFGLFRGAELVGVSVFSHPVNDAVLRPLPGAGLERCELGRFVLLNAIERNGESWFIARSFELLKCEGIVGVLSFSDPTPRTTLDGRRTHPGHIGTIYQATNAIYTGRGDARTLKVFPDATVFSHRAEGKLRKMERGWKHVLSLLQRHGAGHDFDGDGVAYLDRWLPRITRPLKHPGNHRYLFGLTRAAKKALPSTLRAAGLEVLGYPKLSMFGEAC